MTLAKRPIFTLGHSTHSLEAFMDLLRQHEVAAVADVRSSPYSRFNPQFNRELLSVELKAQGISYVFLGRQLGARSEEPGCYEKGRVQFPRLAKTPLFLEGIERIIGGADAYRITLMCAEKDPIECHRALLVSRKFFELGIPVNHILADGAIQTHEELESRLLSMCNLPDGDMFTSREEFIAQAYSIQGNRVAYQFTIGFTQKNAEQFFNHLKQPGLTRVIDVRLNNVSQLAGFTKMKDLQFFLREINNLDYVHLPELAPTKEILDGYKKNGGDWKSYEKLFLSLMAARRVENLIDKDLVDGDCLLCSEVTPEHCHRRLVAEYFRDKWGNVEIVHL